MLLGRNTNILDQEGFDGMIHSKRGNPRQECLPSKHSYVLQREPDDNIVKPVILPEGRLPKGRSKERFANISLSTGHEEVCTRLSSSRFGLSGTEHSDMLEGIKVDRRESKYTTNYSMIELLERETQMYTNEPCRGMESQSGIIELHEGEAITYEPCQGTESQTEYVRNAHDGSCHDDRALNIATKKQQQEEKVSFLSFGDSIVPKYQVSSSLVWIRIYSSLCRDISKLLDPVSLGPLFQQLLDSRKLPDEIRNKLKSMNRLVLRFVKEYADWLRQYNSTMYASEDRNRNMALSRCMGLLLHYYQIVSKEQKLNDYCFFDELLDCIEFLTVFHECSRLLKSVINHNTEGLAVDRLEEAYARVRQSFADIRKNVERWCDAVLHSTVALFSKGSFNSTVRQLMNRNVTTFGKGGNGELVEAFQSGKCLIIKKTLLRESEWSIATEMSHPNVLPWLALICGGRSDSKPGQIVSYQVMPKMTEDLSASIKKMGGSIHHYILQLQDSEEPNAVLSARADLVRLRGAEILRRVLLGLDYMHQQNVVHRDIKASNILLKKPVDCPHEAVHTCTCPGGWEVKVADFDSVIHLGVARDRASRRKQLKVGNTGTSGYRAPEVFYESSTSDINDPDYYSPASDIWSFGGVCLHLAMGFCCPRMQYQVSLMTLAHHRMVNIPAAEAQEKVDRTTGIYHIRQGFTGEKWLDMVNFTARPLQVDRSKRPSARSLLQDTYLEQACLPDSSTDGTTKENSTLHEAQTSISLDNKENCS